MVKTSINSSEDMTIQAIIIVRQSGGCRSQFQEHLVYSKIFMKHNCKLKDNLRLEIHVSLISRNTLTAIKPKSV